MTSHGLEIGQAINNRRRAAITITIITVRTLAGDEYPVEVDGVQIAAWRWAVRARTVLGPGGASPRLPDLNELLAAQHPDSDLGDPTQFKLLAAEVGSIDANVLVSPGVHSTAQTPEAALSGDGSSGPAAAAASQRCNACCVPKLTESFPSVAATTAAPTAAAAVSTATAAAAAATATATAEAAVGERCKHLEDPASCKYCSMAAVEFAEGAVGRCLECVAAGRQKTVSDRPGLRPPNGAAGRRRLFGGDLDLDNVVAMFLEEPTAAVEYAANVVASDEADVAFLVAAEARKSKESLRQRQLDARRPQPVWLEEGLKDPKTQEFKEVEAFPGIGRVAGAALKENGLATVSTLVGQFMVFGFDEQLMDFFLEEFIAVERHRLSTVRALKRWCERHL